MAENLLNEAERFLVERWAEGHLLEKSMEGVRTKYKELFERIVDTVSHSHPELDSGVVYVTQFWGPGSIGFARKSWPAGDTRWPSGLWLENLRLELLASDESDSPYGCLWFSNKSKFSLDLDAARGAVSAAAKELLNAKELKGTGIADSHRTLLYFDAPAKNELLRAFCDGDGTGFVDLFVSQLDLMARFVPVLDKVFRQCAVKE